MEQEGEHRREQLVVTPSLQFSLASPRETSFPFRLGRGAACDRSVRPCRTGRLGDRTDPRRCPTHADGCPGGRVRPDDGSRHTG